MIKQNSIKLWNASPTIYANYRGVNYGIATDTELYSSGTYQSLDANTIDLNDKRATVYFYSWKDSRGQSEREWTCMPAEVFLYTDDELIQDYDYLHFRGMTKDGIIGSNTMIMTKFEISPDKHYGKITFPNFYGIQGIWTETNSNNVKYIIYNKLVDYNAEEWMRGYFKSLNNLSTTKTLFLGRGWLNRLSEETIKIATDKGWTLT